MGKGENAGYQHFLLFPQCFQKPCSESLKEFNNVICVRKRRKIVVTSIFCLSTSSVLSFSQMTNFRLLQTEREGQNFEFDENYPKGFKTLGKGEIALVFSKWYSPYHQQIIHLRSGKCHVSNRFLLCERLLTYYHNFGNFNMELLLSLSEIC